MSKEFTYTDKVNWVYKKYANAITRSHPNGLNEEMKMELGILIVSDDFIELYYDAARRITYQQPLWLIKIIINKKLSPLIKGTSLLGVKAILAEQLIRGATKTVINKSSTLVLKNDYCSNSFPKKKPKIFPFVKILTNLLARWKTPS